MQNTFRQRFVMTVLAGFAAASLIYFYRHVIERSRYEMNEGWQESTFGPPAARSR